MSHTQSLTRYTASFIDELVQAGITDMVVSPGSRSTPMAILMAEHPSINLYMNVDERSAGFFALGLAKASKNPVVLLCTSGTAAANYFPAIVEANLSRVPLIVLTADRPHELRNVGAPQAIDQIHLFGSHVKWFNEMALPENDESMISYVKAAANRAVGAAKSNPSGPVHLNFPFREPLIPDLSGEVFESVNGTDKKSMPPKVMNGSLHLDDTQLDELFSIFSEHEKGIIVCGPMDAAAGPIIELAERLGYPVLPDPLSQLRSCSEDVNQEILLEGYDAFLRTEAVKQELKPDVVLRLGAMPVSKSAMLFMKNLKSAQHVVVDSGSGWRDPSHISTTMVYSDENSFCQSLIKRAGDEKRNTGWLKMWKEINSITIKNMSQIELAEDMDEGKVFFEMANNLPENSGIFVGNSMPIRDIDSFFFNNKKNIHVMANRGANGIDGVVSSALGASAHIHPMHLVIGDLSFFHDMNGLLAANMNKLNLTIIILNNNGGGIFSYLPQAEKAPHFELLFGTPTNLDFKHTAALYGADYILAENWDDFNSALINHAENDGLKIIEVQTNREKNVQVHRELWNTVSREIEDYLKGDK
ncbi:2-succinyl-5-enolpyruvyl-6-hydroxy-3-cyclohexene-1-carboxylic-acid synthase [Falsibacillus pallidus]|uniref:2-succinyl-5-enolpyruvyl-6-hydroxy-3-cyclohexene-1-carboxylate synthase n=1 Tax=Falsibacillus pallidus TaxID=493781 RepID=A0A370GM73_9BACI|nr:2-succinyl-5-enolpyruvyl-6-hydroxy-3-cyclohexene-1-carboxylic-acid synthase [Falsibacillus pallidus]RDI44376.1 2-succinyl-5-enolpyruvyl-6-hydroxy-3-cyclohexene-1-carboxylate synthase [Falsibacillus pallidus]